MGRLGYRPALDGIRAIAVTAVLLYHTSFASGGFFGVDLFFVLSGFLITTLLLEEHGERGTFSLAAFYVRRARRLYPALVVLVVVAATAVSLAGGLGFLPHADVVPSDAAGAFGLVYGLNIVLATHHLISHNALVHLWSLGEEEQFYLLWPPVLLVLLRRVPRTTVAVALAGLAVAAQLRLVEVSHHADNWRTYTGPDTHALPLVVGCLLAFAPRLRVTSIVGAVGLAIFDWIIFHTWNGQTAAVHYGPVVSAVSCLMILGSLNSGLFARLLGAKPLAWLGRISYGLYLWQVPVLAFIPHTPVLAIALSFALASASYRYVERPFRRARERRSEQVVDRRPAVELVVQQLTDVA